MFQYELDTGRINRFLNDNPTLVQQRRKLAKGGKRFAEAEEVEHFVGSAIQSAGERFLARIHQEIHDAKPQWEKDAIARELTELETPEQKPTVTDELGRPELTTEYLISIGREDLTVW